MHGFAEAGTDNGHADCFRRAGKLLRQRHGLILPNGSPRFAVRSSGNWRRTPMRRLYTRRGDLGETDLLGDRVAKDDPRIELIGELDETTSFLGLARSLSRSERANQILVDLQRDLYRVMADLAF